MKHLGHRAVLLLTAVSLARATPAWGNGALPASGRVLVPPGTQTIVLSTNFGLVTSVDNGKTWSWMCEHDQSAMGNSYQLAAGPAVRVMALGTGGLIASDDLGCGWSVILDPNTALPVDFFPDPVDANRVLGLAILRGGQRQFAILDLKTDATAAPPLPVLYMPPLGQQIDTIEISRSNPSIIYATLSIPGGNDPASVARTDDAGKTWTVTTPDAATTNLGIVAVDPEDPSKIYFLVVTDTGDKLVVSQDSGKTLHDALPPGPELSAFVRLPNGHVLVGWLDINKGYIYRSTDAGTTFTSVPTTIHPRAFAERDGIIYASTDFFSDKFALATSSDEGTTWTPVVSLDQVHSLSACNGAADLCITSCLSLVMNKVFDKSVCSATAPPDAGPAMDAAADSAPEAAPPKSSGCSCQSAASPVAPGGLALLAVVWLIVALKRARK